MSDLRAVLVDYLQVRRALGCRLVVAERLLCQFLDFMEERGAAVITTELATRWASRPSAVRRGWIAQRFSVVRGFATFVATVDGTTEVPPAGCLPGSPACATPYLYSDEDVEAIMAAARRLRHPLLAITYETLIGLLERPPNRRGDRTS